MGDAELVRAVGEQLLPLESDGDLDPLLERIGDARIVLLGEASHGTHEFYTWRDRISRRLIAERGFSFIAVEGDWPDCYTLNLYARQGDDAPAGGAREVLHAFSRWPTWMWANQEVVELGEWLRAHNRGRGDRPKVGFYGLDVYSLWESMDVVTRYLERVDPALAERARNAYGCFDPFQEDVQEYAWATEMVPTDCEEEVVQALAALRQKGPDFRRDDAEAWFNAEQNALVAANAEHYYREMIRGGPASWNVRDRHMMETLERLLRHHGPQSKAIVWEHNTHVGDARATDMARAGMVNVGQLAREAYGEQVAIVGFASHRGSVIAGKQWGAEMEAMPVPPARRGSWEQVLHDASGGRDGLLLLDGLDEVPGALDSRGHRAIGVVYHPEREALGNYVPTVLPYRYDALLWIDESHALNPLHYAAVPDHEVPETFPSGM